MTLYTRPQLLLLLAFLGAAGLGLAARDWRARHPDLVERLEQFDHLPEPPAAPAPTPPTPPASVAAAEEDSPGALTRPLDLNRASAEDLVRLPGIGPVLAARIVTAREAAGPFASVDDLRRVPGLGPARLERLRPLVTVGE